MDMLPGLMAHDPARRGYHVAYHPDGINRCPGCGRTSWHIGRSSAECGFCHTALPLAAGAHAYCLATPPDLMPAGL